MRFEPILLIDLFGKSVNVAEVIINQKNNIRYLTCKPRTGLKELPNSIHIGDFNTSKITRMRDLFMNMHVIVKAIKNSNGVCLLNQSILIIDLIIIFLSSETNVFVHNPRHHNGRVNVSAIILSIFAKRVFCLSEASMNVFNRLTFGFFYSKMKVITHPLTNKSKFSDYKIDQTNFERNFERNHF